jgi:hypothetical protein
VSVGVAPRPSHPPASLPLFAVAALLLATLGFARAADSAIHDRYGGLRALRAEATGWFRVAPLQGRWFFITPEGHALFSLGVSHTVECTTRDERDLFTTRYGRDEPRLAAFFLTHLRTWGYNSTGYGALPSLQRQLPYVAEIWTEGPRSFSAGEKSVNTDLFDPAVGARLQATVRAAAARHRDNPFCLGYVFIDLPVWHPRPPRGPGYVEFFRSLPAGAPGRAALEQFRRDHPGADDEAFLNHVAARYYTITTTALRAADPHHLILGDRLMALPERTPDSILRTAAKFVDVLSFQPMGTPKPIGAYLDRVHQLTGKPVLLADVNTMTMRPAKDLADSTAYERAAGEHTLAYYLDAARSRACLGLHRCTLRDYQPWNLQYHRRGLLRADDTPYPLLVDYTRRTNAEVLRLVHGPAP